MKKPARFRRVVDVSPDRKSDHTMPIPRKAVVVRMVDMVWFTIMPGP